jgi:methylsterol monooxygenase
MYVLEPVWNIVVDTPLLRSAAFHLIATTIETYLLFLVFLPLDLGWIKAKRLESPIKSDNSVKAYKNAWIMSLKNTIYLFTGMGFIIYALTGDIHGGYTIQGIPSSQWPTITPTLFQFIWQILVIILCMDFLMYWLHRAYHWGPLYKYFHSVHHAFHETISIHSMCVHAVELFSIVPMLFIAPRVAYELFGLHPLSVYCAPYVMALHGILEHCGYDDGLETISFGLVTGAKMHIVHHNRPLKNFGFYTYFWDWLFGTKLSYDDMVKE